MKQHSEVFIRLANEARQRIREVTPAEAHELLSSGAVVLDVRDREEFASEHIEGATHLSRGTLEMRVHELIPDKRTPVVCYCMGGNRGALAADTLQSLGYTSVTSIRGGMKSYLEFRKGSAG
jgi:rhodanese-related sulfurtransferase